MKLEDLPVYKHNQEVDFDYRVLLMLMKNKKSWTYKRINELLDLFLGMEFILIDYGGDLLGLAFKFDLKLVTFGIGIKEGKKNGSQKTEPTKKSTKKSTKKNTVKTPTG